jgi:DNA invertase Pin-like site-specific DNA recombinase
MTTQKRTRFVIYTRYSSDMQNEMSLEDQEACCRRAVAERGGVVVGVYSDSAKTGWSLDRDGFNEMRVAAEHDKFDAAIFWKFDRLARDHDHAVMIKMLLRHEYGLKLYCVEGFSEDDDNSPYGAMMEQMLAVFSAFYSRNLSTETKRAKEQRAIRGEFNGSNPPLGYDLVLVGDATPERPAGLYLNPEQAEVVCQAFERYLTGNYSDGEIGDWMNEQPVIQVLRAGIQPVGRDMVRDMLQNQVYTGRVPHCDTQYNGTLGQGRKSSRGRRVWYEGRHEALISDELFEQCQAVRAKLARNRKTERTMRTYILHDRTFCVRCIIGMPHGLHDDNYSKMRPYWDNRREAAYYRCLSKERGYGTCEQYAVRAAVLDQQVVEVLSNLKIPEDFRERVENAVRSRVENEAALKRMEEIKDIIERIDFRWDNGFIDKTEYFEKRLQLEREVDSLRPIDYDELHEAADLIQNFRSYWDQCAQFDNPDEARQQLLHKIVERVFIYEQQVVGIALHGDFSIVLDGGDTMPMEISQALGEKITAHRSEATRSQFGDDGGGSLTGYVFFGEKLGYQRVVTVAFSLKKAA